jgi:hypothetical protein
MHERNQQKGFSSPESFRVITRADTRLGRYVDLDVIEADWSALDDSLELNVLVEMEGLPYGLQAFG